MDHAPHEVPLKLGFCKVRATHPLTQLRERARESAQRERERLGGIQCVECFKGPSHGVCSMNLRGAAQKTSCGRGDSSPRLPAMPLACPSSFRSKGLQFSFCFICSSIARLRLLACTCSTACCQLPTGTRLEYANAPCLSRATAACSEERDREGERGERERERERGREEREEGDSARARQRRNTFCNRHMIATNSVCMCV